MLNNKIEENTLPFNMSLFFYQELHKIRKNKVLCLLEDRIEEYFWCLDQVFVYLSFKYALNIVSIVSPIILVIYSLFCLLLGEPLVPFAINLFFLILIVPPYY